MSQRKPLYLAIAAVLAVHSPVTAAAPGDVVRISKDAAGVPGNYYSYSWRSANNHISADGRYVAFYSEASNLSNDDTDVYSDVYVYDRQNGTLELVSRAGAAGSKGNSHSYDPSVSADGRYVAFYSFASNLSNDDADAYSDVYVYDRQSGTVELVSRAGAGGAKGNDYSSHPSISADGRYVAFYSEASNLGDGDTDTIGDIHVYDRQSGTVELISRAGAAGSKGNGQSISPSISADGRYVAFFSVASNLGDGDTDTIGDIHVYDRQTGTLELVSRAGAAGSKGDYYSFEPSISADGRYVAFYSYASNLSNDDTDTYSDVYVYDRQSGRLELVSRAGAAGPKGNSHSYDPSVSADGRYVAFRSQASNLGDGDTDTITDIHVYDRQTGTIHLMSRHADGTKGNNESFYSAISPDGTLLAFTSYATNLDGPQNYLQVFVKETGLEAGGTAANQPPVADAGADRTIEATSANGASVTLDGSASSDPDAGDGIVAYDWSWPPSGTASGTAPVITLPLGSTTLTLTVKDKDGAESSDTVAVNVVDTTAPAVTPPVNVTVEAAGPSTPTVLGSATVTDAVSTDLVATPDQTGPFAVGVHTVVWSATDAAGNTGTATQTVTITDTTAPTLSLPDAMTQAATGAAGAAVSFSASASDLVDGSVPVNCSPASGSAFTLGSTTVSCTAVDNGGNTANGSFNVNVVDNTAPTLTCPANINGIVGEEVDLGTATVSDEADASTSLTNDAPDSFAPGSTTVTWTAADASGNHGSCQQLVNLNYNFEGFFQPVDNSPIVNTVKSGKTVPIVWRLLNKNGENVTDTATLVGINYARSSCSKETEDAIEKTISPVGSVLIWDIKQKTFLYKWKTPALPGKCVKLTLTFDDGVSQSADFKLK